MASAPTKYTSVLPDDGMKSSVRVVGSNYTAFFYRGTTIAYLESVNDSGQAALSNNGQGFEFVHPLGFETPTDVVTSRVLDGGTLTLSIRELWNAEVWEQLSELTGTKNIADIFHKLALSPDPVTCTKVIFPPAGKPYGKLYHGCVIVKVDDGDQVEIGQLSVAKNIVIAYTHTTDYSA